MSREPSSDRSEPLRRARERPEQDTPPQAEIVPPTMPDFQTTPFGSPPDVGARNVAALQRAIGNRAVAKLIAGNRSGDNNDIRRHSPGAPLLGGIATAPGAGGGGAAQPAPVTPSAGGSVPASPGTTPAATGGSTGAGTAAAAPAGGAAAPAAPAPAAPAPAAPAPAGPTPTPGPAAGTPAAAGGGPAPVELAMPTLQTAYAQNAIQSAFGTVAGRPIITGNITVVANQAALYAVYDQWMIDHNRQNSDTGTAWVAGDKLRWNNARGLRTNAFAEPAPSTNIFIDATQTDPTATVHEMLHVNTAPGFVGEVGRAVNEGITQRLAVQAIQATGQSVAGSENTYQQEQGVVSALVRVVGEGVVKQAYFGGAATLIQTYEAVMGEDTWAVLKRTLSADTAAGYTAAAAILQPPSVATKIRLINTLLDWWVSDNDLDIVQRIVSTCSPAERSQIAAAIQPRVIELTDLGQRTRLRIILGG